MKNIYILIIFILSVFMLTLPMVVFPEKVTPKTPAPTESSAPEVTPKVEKSTKSAPLPDDTVRLYISGEKRIEKIKMQDYLFSVVASEIPLTYGKEAIKAQIVAAHTYTLYRKKMNSKEKYDISDNPETSQTYKPKSEIKKVYGKSYKKYESYLAGLINDAYPYIVTYKGEPILAAYHGMSAGFTESSENVWGGKLPYLTAVESICDKMAPDYITVVKCPISEANDRLFSLKITAKELLESTPAKSKSGYVLNIKTAGGKISGGSITVAFSLRSSNFDINRSGDNIVFTVRGNGHGVGMSQNGADYMAKNGDTFTDILKHYYKGTKITKIAN